MVFLSLVPVKSLKSIVLPQLSFCTYSTAFNVVNGNASYNRRPYESILLGTGVIASTAFFGLFLRLLLMKSAVKNVFLRETLPAAILTQVSAMNVAASRSFEPIRGIEVMDKEGNVVGYSRKAGTKAVSDTATSRVVLFGTSAFIPEVFSHFFKKTPLFVRYPQSLWTLKLSCTILVMGLMVPVSFSMFPQIQRIQCSKLEQEIQSATEETELFYNRGV
nr:sideroflexin 4 [Myotis myotis]